MSFETGEERERGGERGRGREREREGGREGEEEREREWEQHERGIARRTRHKTVTIIFLRDNERKNNFSMHHFPP